MPRFPVLKSMLVIAMLAGATSGTSPRADDIACPSAAAAQAALAKARPGDTIVLADGVYPNAVFQIKTSGEENRPVTLRPATPGGAVLTAQSTIEVIGARFVVIDGFVFDQVWNRKVAVFMGARDCRLTNCAFIESGDPKSTFPRIVEFDGGTRQCRADHCYMRGNLSMGMGVPIREETPPEQYNSHNRFDHNWFHDIVRRRNNGQEAVFLGGGQTDTPYHTTVEYNLFHNASGDSEIISNKSGYNILRFNTFRDCKAALTLRGGVHVRVEGNFFFNNTYGVRAYGAYHQIVNNYIENCRTGLMIPTGTGYEVKYYSTFYVGLHDSTIASNTIVNCPDAAIDLGKGVGTEGKATEAWKKFKNWDGNLKYDKVPKNNRFTGNLLVIQDKPPVVETASADTRWQDNYYWTAAPAVQVDAKFARPFGGSVAKTDGLWRPAPGAAQPAGCDYATLGGELRRPLKPADVGPEWMRGDPANIRRIPQPQTPPKD